MIIYIYQLTTLDFALLSSMGAAIIIAPYHGTYDEGASGLPTLLSETSSHKHQSRVFLGLQVLRNSRLMTLFDDG